MSDFLLSRDEIHVWRAELEVSPEKLRDYRKLLSEDETARADRLHREEDRRHFTAARGILRWLLGRYLQAPPQKLCFSYTARGRPYLMGNFEAAIPDFNLAHSSGLALFAFALERKVGVDLESPSRRLDVAAIAKRYFHPTEVVRMMDLPDLAMRQEFFRLWTRKEACLKASGAGISGMAELPIEELEHRIEALELGAEWSAALAYSGAKARLRFFPGIEV